MLSQTPADQNDFLIDLFNDHFKKLTDHLQAPKEKQDEGK
jgi:hypothetical protein